MFAIPNLFWQATVGHGSSIEGGICLPVFLLTELYLIKNESFPPATNFIRPAYMRSKVLGESGFFTIKDTFPFIGKVQNFLYGFPLRQAAEKVAAPGL